LPGPGGRGCHPYQEVFFYKISLAISLILCFINQIVRVNIVEKEMSRISDRPQTSPLPLPCSAELISFPARRAAPPRSRLQTALANLDRALADQRSVLATWRGALADLRGAMHGLDTSVAIYRGELGKLTTGVAHLHARALWLRAWASRVEADQAGADHSATNGQPPARSGRSV